MLDLNHLRTLQQVVQSGSFTVAATRLNLPKSTVSRQIARLEDELGTQLFQRTTRKLQPTSAAVRLAQSMDQALHHIQDAESEILQRGSGLSGQPGSQPHGQLRGQLRVTAPVEFGASLLQSILPAFLAKHPELEVELYLSDRLVDLIREGFDLAIRAGDLPDSSFKARKLGVERFLLLAAPSYLKKAGTPKMPEDLARFSCLRASSLHPTPVWEFHQDRKRVRVTVPSKLAINNLLVLRDWAVNGQGITLIPHSLCRTELAERQLVPLLPDWQPELYESPLHAIYPAQRFVAPKVSAFVEFLVEKLARTL